MTLMTLLGYGILLWFIPFIIACCIFSIQQTDEHFFKTLMIVTSTVTGVVLINYTFHGVKNSYIATGIYHGITWLIINWVLDFFVLLPLSGQSVDRYFLETGLRYLNAPIMTIGFAFALEYQSNFQKRK